MRYAFTSLALLAACASVTALVWLPAAASAQDVQIVEITAERFSFNPSEIRVKAGTRLEIRLTSEDTMHGFHIIGTDIDLELPKRGRGVASVMFQPHGRPLHVRMLEVVRRRTFVHARRHHRDRVTRRSCRAGALVRTSFGRTATAVARRLASEACSIAQVTAASPGDPLAGVTPVEFEEFRLGLDDFLEVETSDEGLGPAYQRDQLRRLPQRACRRRYRTHLGSASRASRSAR